MIASQGMTLDELREAYREACEWSNWYHDGEQWPLAEWWSLRALELHAAVERRSRQ